MSITGEKWTERGEEDYRSGPSVRKKVTMNARREIMKGRSKLQKTYPANPDFMKMTLVQFTV